MTKVTRERGATGTRVTKVTRGRRSEGDDGAGGPDGVELARDTLAMGGIVQRTWVCRLLAHVCCDRTFSNEKHDRMVIRRTCQACKRISFSEASQDSTAPTDD